PAPRPCGPLRRRCLARAALRGDGRAPDPAAAAVSGQRDVLGEPGVPRQHRLRRRTAGGVSLRGGGEPACGSRSEAPLSEAAAGAVALSCGRGEERHGAGVRLGDTLSRILAALAAAGTDPEHIGPDDPAMPQEFHTLGPVAAAALGAAPGLGPYP